MKKLHPPNATATYPAGNRTRPGLHGPPRRRPRCRAAPPSAAPPSTHTSGPAQPDDYTLFPTPVWEGGSLSTCPFWEGWMKGGETSRRQTRRKKFIKPFPSWPAPTSGRSQKQTPWRCQFCAACPRCLTPPTSACPTTLAIPRAPLGVLAAGFWGRDKQTRTPTYHEGIADLHQPREVGYRKPSQPARLMGASPRRSRLFGGGGFIGFPIRVGRVRVPREGSWGSGRMGWW